MVDQAAYSLQNFLVLFAALRLLPLGPLGEYTLVSTLLILVQTSIRSLVLEPLTIRFSTASDADRRRAAAMAAGASAVLGMLAIAGTVVWSAAGGSSGRLLIAASITLGALLVQDAWRSTLFSARRPWATALNDWLCLAVTVGVLGMAVWRGHPDGAAVMLIWAAGTGAGAVFGVVQIRVLPNPLKTLSWLRKQGDLGVRLVGSVLAQQGAGRASLIVVSAWAGDAALGQISASRTLVSPINTLIVATFALAVPDAAERLQRSLRHLRRFTTLVSGALVGVTALLTLVFFFLPGHIGHVIAGSNWGAAHALLIPTALWIAGTASSQGARIGLRALERASTILWVSVALGLLLLIACALGTFLWGATGAAWGFGLASLGGQVLWTLSYRRAAAAWTDGDGRRAQDQRRSSVSRRSSRSR